MNSSEKFQHPHGQNPLGRDTDRESDPESEEWFNYKPQCPVCAKRILEITNFCQSCGADINGIFKQIYQFKSKLREDSVLKNLEIEMDRFIATQESKFSKRKQEIFDDLYNDWSRKIKGKHVAKLESELEALKDGEPSEENQNSEKPFSSFDYGPFS